MVPGTRHGEGVVVVVMVVKRRWEVVMYGGAAAKVGGDILIRRGNHRQCNRARNTDKKHLPEAKRQHKETVARSVTAQLSSRSSEGSVYCCWRPSGRTGWRGIGRLAAGDFGGELKESVGFLCICVKGETDAHRGRSLQDGGVWTGELLEVRSTKL